MLAMLLLILNFASSAAFAAPSSLPRISTLRPLAVRMVLEEEAAHAQQQHPGDSTARANLKPLLPLALAAGAVLTPTAAHAATSMASIADTAWAQALSLIFVSELGDKTFFIAALLAARASKLLTFAGCAGALALMTAISVVIGQVFHAVPTSITRGLPIDDYVAIVSFLFFGIKSLLDALAIEEDGAGIAEEREEAEETLVRDKHGDEPSSRLTQTLMGV